LAITPNTGYACNVFDCAESWHKKITAAAHSNKLGQVAGFQLWACRVSSIELIGIVATQ
jgi:hypothetical protein